MSAPSLHAPVPTLLRVLIVAACLSLTAAHARADDFKRLTGDEIRSRISGHVLSGSNVLSGEKTRTDWVGYWSADGKTLLEEIRQDSRPTKIMMMAVEIKGDQLCLHDLGLMRQKQPDSCYAAYLNQANKFPAGYLANESDQTSVEVDDIYDADTQEAEARLANWAGIQQAAGPVDAFGSLDDIAINPYRFQGRVQIVKGQFHQMIDDRTGWFYSTENLRRAFVVTGVPNDLFQADDQLAIIVGEFTRAMRMSIDGNDEFLPVMTAKVVRLCKTDDCDDYFRHWH